MKDEKPLGMRLGESAFCAGYLAFALIAGLRFASAARTGGPAASLAAACAAMTLLLGCGDAFHLVPRIAINLQGATQDARQLESRHFWLGLGNLVSSVTMTVFYVLLFDALRLLSAVQSTVGTHATGPVRAVLVALAVVRVAFCLLPQNRWFDGEGSRTWGIYRNIPFVAMGVITVFYLVAWYGQWLMAALVGASFACYMGVVLYAHERPMMGMLMIPKTICYIWLITLFLGQI